jgi:zinc protease
MTMINARTFPLGGKHCLAACRGRGAAGRLALAACLLICTVMTIMAPPASAQQEINIPYTRFVLDNGLTLIVHEDHKAPIVAINVWYHVGSKNEKPGKTGFAHLFEHLMFNGSEHFNDDYFIPLEKVGATDLNGTTSEDRTNYFQNVPSTAVDLVLFMESDRMGHLLGAIDQGKLDEQRGVVQNEKRQGENQPYGKAYELLTLNTYPAGHPYSWTVIGSMEDLNAAKLEDVQQWFKDYYGAANAVICIAGDIDPETAKQKVEKYFGDIPSGPPVTRQESWVAKLTGEHRQTTEDRVPQARLYMVWNIPEYGAPDATYLDLATDVLAQGKNSRLYKRLVYQDQIATDISAYIDSKEIGGQVLIQASAQPGGDLAKVEAAIREELAKFLNDGPTAEEMDRVKTQYRARFLRGIERIGGFGGKSDILIQGEVFLGQPDFYKTRLERVAKSSAQDIQRSSKQWLSDGVFVLEVHPFPQYKNTDEGVDRSKLPEVTSFPSLDLPETRKATLSNGLKVVLAERHEIPIVDFGLLIDAGYAADQFAAPGTASLTMDMVDEGTKTRSSLEISEALDQLGSNLQAGAHLDTCTVSLSSLKENLDASLDIFADVILNPTFPQADFARLQRQRLARIGQEKAQPVGIALRLLPELIFGSKHAYGNPLTGSGTEASVQAMKREDLVKFHATWFQPGNATLVVAGDTTLDAILPQLEAKLGAWKNTAKPPQKNLTQVPMPAKRVVYVVDKPDAMQSMIIAGTPAPPTNNPDEIAIETMNTILGGSFTSRINMNLREDKHWAYGARSILYDAKGQRLFFTYAPVQSDKTKESMVEIDKELRGILGDRPPTPEELDKARKNMTLQLPGRFETKRALESAMEDIVVYGLPEDYYETYAGKVNSMDLEKITAAAKQIVHPDQMVWIVVGDQAKIQKGIDELGFGEIHKMSPDGKILN